MDDNKSKSRVKNDDHPIMDVQKYYSRLGGLLFEWKRRKGEIKSSNPNYYNDTLKNELIKLQEEIDEYVEIGNIWGIKLKKYLKGYKPLSSVNKNESTPHPKIRVPKKRGRKRDPELLSLRVLLHKKTKELTNKKKIGILEALRLVVASDDQLKSCKWADSTLRRYYYEIDGIMK